MGNFDSAFREMENVLVFKISRYCPVGCSFCYDPEGKREELKTDEIKRWLREADESGEVKTLSLTGGEPFVHFDEILKMGQTAKELGWGMSITTSAYWARNPDMARERLRRLKELGLFRINFSCDPGHQQRVPLEYVRNALYAGIELGLTGFVVGTFTQESQRVEDFLGPSPAPGKYIFVSRMVAPYGRARNLPRSPAWQETQSEKILENWYCYRKFGHDILVQPNAEVLPCCSITNSTNPLIVGNLREGDHLGTLIQKITDNFLLRVIKHDSFEKLRQITERHFPGATREWPDVLEVDGPCSFCSRLFGDRRLQRPIYEALQKEEPLYWDELVQKHTQKELVYSS